jgi:hypothetical protein
VAREEDGYDGHRGAVAERLGRGLQSLVQRFESARRLASRRLVSLVSQPSTEGHWTKVDDTPNPFLALLFPAADHLVRARESIRLHDLRDARRRR